MDKAGKSDSLKSKRTQRSSFTSDVARSGNLICVQNGQSAYSQSYRALSDLFSFAVLSGNTAWLRSLVARERGEEGE
jgi:hypothetical protein